MNQKPKRVSLLYIFMEFIFPFIPFFAYPYFIMRNMELTERELMLHTIFCSLFLCAWLMLAPMVLQRIAKSYRSRYVRQSALAIDHVIDGANATMWISKTQKKIILSFDYNPFCCYTIPISDIENVWVDDGKVNAGIFTGSKRVSLCMMMYGKKYRFCTFISRSGPGHHTQNYAMTSSVIVDAVNEARILMDMFIALGVQITYPG